MTPTKVRLLFLLILWSASSYAQVNDAGMWLSFKASYDLNKKTELSVSPEIRLHENITQIQGIFSDFGVEYKLSKLLFTSLVYRVGARQNLEWYDMRQRLSFGLGFKQKFGDFGITFLSRYQAAKNAVGDQSDPDLSVYWRNKLTLKYGGVKKMDFSTSFELFNPADAYSTFEATDWRWNAEIERKLSKRRFISVGYLIQKNVNSSPQQVDYVIQVGYKYLPDFDRKKKEEETTDPAK